MNKISILFIILMLLGTNRTSAQSQNSTNFRNQYVGIRYKDYRELKEITKINSTMINLHYGIAVMKKADKHFLFLSRFENSLKSNDDFQLKVIEVVEIPKFNNFYHCVSVKGCSLKGVEDPTLFALAVIEQQKYLTKIVKAWKLDKPTGKILDFPHTDIKCLNQAQMALANE
ncbi:hypothetical protein [Emticicia sp. SJ17W-69]|uniref:hypothetical protein n=1 Tax=Emticicia sp. SJ17W-69 TaxID=3421657 RepID=UPI003EB9A278